MTSLTIEKQKITAQNKNFLPGNATGCRYSTTNERKESKMITSTSKNNSFPCVREVCDDQIIGCLECEAQVEQQAHPLRKYLHDLWINIRLFLGTDRWDRAVTLQRGDSHYTIKMDDIEARWRNM